MNITGQSVYVTFERLITTDDIDDISFTSNVYFMFSMGSYSLLNDTDDVELENHFFRKPLETSIDLINCISSKNTF